MNGGPIQLQLESGEVTVGQQVRARVSWQHQSSPASLRVELQWFTEGRGDTDVGTVDQLVLSADQGPIPPVVEAALTVPMAGPASYDGQLIRIRWRVRARLDLRWKLDPTAEAHLVVLPYVVEDA